MHAAVTPSWSAQEGLPLRVRFLLADLEPPPDLMLPDWDAGEDVSRTIRLYRDASTDGLGASLEEA